MSKGDGRRPTLVEDEEFERRWRMAFGGKKEIDGKKSKSLPDAGSNPAPSTLGKDSDD